jgi:hypothetical protein
VTADTEKNSHSLLGGGKFTLFCGRGRKTIKAKDFFIEDVMVVTSLMRRMRSGVRYLSNAPFASTFNNNTNTDTQTSGRRALKWKIWEKLLWQEKNDYNKVMLAT